MSVFVFDSSSGLIKITRRGNKYYVYRLKEVQEFAARGHSFMMYTSDHTYKFIWESSASEHHNYKPYEDRDVSSDPSIYVDNIKRWHPHKIRKMI